MKKIEGIHLLTETEKIRSKSFGIIGYASDEGVKRNKGRIGAEKGPNIIKQTLGPMPNPLSKKTNLYDFGNITCLNNDLENGSRKFSILHNQNFK